MTTLKSFGDSNTVGNGINSNQRYAQIYAERFGHVYTNHAANGDMAKEQSYKIQSVTPGDVNTILLGTNDTRAYGNSAYCRDGFIKYLRAMCVYLSCNRVNARSMSVISGTWQNNVGHYNGYDGNQNLLNYIGRYTTTVGGKISGTVTGTTVYLGYTMMSHYGANGKFEVRIDGNLVDTVDGIQDTDLVNSFHNVLIGMFCKRYSGLSAGTHTIEITNIGNAASNNCYVDFISGNNDAAREVIVMNIPKMMPSGLNPAPFTHSSNSLSNIADYNSAIATMVSELKSDGLNIKLADLHSLIDENSDLHDGLHLKSSGHSKAVVALLGAT